VIQRPKRSRFAGRTYVVTYEPQGSIVIDDKPSWGGADHEAQAICVEDGLHHDKERTILMHEVLHQIIELSNTELPEEVEEKICTVLGDALVGHMRDNVMLWRYLLQRPPKGK
jgi:hypothetical protein